MKRILILLLALMPFLAGAQGFSAEDGKITWQLVYDKEVTNGNVSIDDIFLNLVYSGDYSNIIRVKDNIILATLNPESIDVEEYGFKRMRAPLFFSNYEIGPVSIRIEVREGRYRVTTNSIKLTNVSSNFAPIGEEEDLEFFTLTEGMFNQQMADYAAPILGEYFIKSFLFLPIEDEEW